MTWVRTALHLLADFLLVAVLLALALAVLRDLGLAEVYVVIVTETRS
jgi:hypothetical protein